MVFFGEHFNVALLTDHIPFNEISIDKERLLRLIEGTLNLRSLLKGRKKERPLALLGLNPHGGEGGG